jgi:hypothetical protein
MANKKKLKKRGPRKYNLGGQQQYSLPTSANATTSNMMGLGDPAMLNRQLMMSNEAVAENANRVRQQMQQQQMMEEEKSKAQVDTSKNRLMDQLKGEGLSGVRTGLNTARALKGTASAAQVAQASGGSTANLLSNLGSYGSAPVGGNAALQGIKAGISNMGPGLGGAALGLAGSGIKHMSNDNDATTMNFGETAGTLMQGAGTGLGVAGLLGGLGATGIGAPLAAIGALGYGIHGLVQKKKAEKEQAKMDEENRIRQINDSRGQSEAFNRAFTMTGSNEGFNIGNSMTNSYIPGQQVMARDGGEKVPGGTIQQLKGGAVEFKGNSHEKGGILIDPQTEVEGGETMDKVQMKGGEESDYIFSDHLKLGGKSFGQRHKEILKRGGGQREIQNLAKLQELIASREAKDPSGRTPDKIMKNGGFYQDGDVINFRTEPGLLSPADPSDPRYELDLSRANVDSLPDYVQSENEQGLYDVITPDEYEILKARNPWFEFGEGEVPEEGEMERFQKEFRQKTGKDIRIDDMLGLQTASAYIPYKMKQEAVAEPAPVTSSAEQEADPTEEETTEDTFTPTDIDLGDPIKKKIAPTWLAALPGLIGLNNPGPYPGAVGATAASGRLANLPRVNLNAARAAAQGRNVAFNRSVQNQASGPAAMSAQLAANRQMADENIKINTSEAAANAGLMGQEAGLRANLGMQNAQMANQVGMYNANQRQRAAENRYEQDIYNRRSNANVITGVTRDAMNFYNNERMANSLDAFGAYTRQKAMKDAKEEKKMGGYFRGLNKIRRK